MFAKKIAILFSVPAIFVSPIHAARVNVGNIHLYKVRKAGLSTDTESLKKDWRAIGKDIKNQSFDV